jgi:chromosomal replication initiation ATPase DnaA
MTSQAYIFPNLSERGKAMFFGRNAMKIEQLQDFDIWIDFVCKELNITIVDFKSKNRKRHLVEARQLACWMYNEYCLLNRVVRLSLEKMGERIGGKDHATVLHCIRTIAIEIANYKDKKDKYQSMYNKLIFEYL